MTVKEFTAMLDGTGIPYAWDHFPTKTDTYSPPDPPFLCYLLPESADFYADGINYSRAESVNLELYTDTWEPGTEQKVIDALEGSGISFRITRQWLDDEKMNMAIFAFETEIEVE